MNPGYIFRQVDWRCGGYISTTNSQTQNYTQEEWVHNEAKPTKGHILSLIEGADGSLVGGGDSFNYPGSVKSTW